MFKNKRATRRMILVELLEHLKTSYHLELTPDTARAILKSRQSIEALVSFRSDMRIEDLQSALARLDSGSFGVCISCKQRMAQAHLDRDVTRRVCPSCETELNRRVNDHLTTPGYIFPPRTTRNTVAARRTPKSGMRP